MIFLSTINLISQNLNGPAPCLTDKGDWGNPITREVNAITLGLSGCSGSCKFEITYYTLMDPSSHLWSISVTNINYPESPDCSGCSPKDIIEALFKILWTENLSSQSFKNSIGLNPCNGQQWTNIQLIFTPANCEKEDHTPCDDYPRCCQSSYQIHMTTNCEFDYYYPSDNDNDELGTTFNGVAGEDIGPINSQNNADYIQNHICNNLTDCSPHCFGLKYETYEDYGCPCEVLQTPSVLHFDEDGTGSSTCCYKLKITNPNDCNVLITNIFGQIQVSDDNTTFTDIDGNNTDVSFSYYSPQEWYDHTPFYTSTNSSPKWRCAWNIDRTPQFLTKTQTTDISKICIPNNGKYYKFTFYGTTNPNEPLRCELGTWIKRCPLPINCCDYLNVTPNLPPTIIDGNCCYTFNISTYNDPACVPVSFSIIDGAHTMNNIPFGTGQNVPNQRFCLTKNTGLHSLQFVFTMKDGTQCTKSLPPLSCVSCCSNLTVTPIIMANSSIGCCYSFHVGITGTDVCTPASLIIYDDFTHSTRFISPVTDANIPMVCIDRNSHNLSFTFILPTGEICVKNIVLSCPDIPSPSNCPSDCQGTFTTDYRNYTLSNGCEVSVNYSYNRNCNGLQVLIINWIIKNYCPISSNDDETMLLTMKQLFDDDPMLFDPLPGFTGCYDNWKVIFKTCWKTTSYPSVENKHVMIPCNTNECCSQEYRVCREPLLVYAIGDPYIPNSECAIAGDDAMPANPPPGWVGCHTLCNLLLWLPPIINDDSIIHKVSFQPRLESDFNGYQCNFESGNLIITSENQSKSSIRVEIYDLLGKIVSQVQKNSNEVSMKIDFNNLISLQGVYMYRIYVNDVIYCVGKFIK